MLFFRTIEKKYAGRIFLGNVVGQFSKGLCLGDTYGYRDTCPFLYALTDFFCNIKSIGNMCRSQSNKTLIDGILFNPFQYTSYGLHDTMGNITI